MAVWSSDPLFPGWSSLYVIDARPVVGLTAMPKSSYRSRLPLHATPLSHTPPKWMVGVAATCVNLLPATLHGMTAGADRAWFTWIGPVNVCPPSDEKL